MGTNGGALSPGHAARPTPGLLYVPFGPLDTRCESDALGIPAPCWFPSLTPAHAGSGHGAGGTDSQTGREEGTLDYPDSPAAAENPSRCPGPPAGARSPGRCAQIQPSLPARCLLTALSAPRQREGAPGRWPGLRANPALRTLGRKRRCAQLRAGRQDARTEPAPSHSLALGNVTFKCIFIFKLTSPRLHSIKEILPKNMLLSIYKMKHMPPKVGGG